MYFSDGIHLVSRAVARLAGCAAIAFAAIGCASGGGGELPVTLRWPDPPDPSRIEYVSIIQSSRDLTGPPSFGDNFKDFIGLDGSAEVRSIIQPADIAVSADGSTVYVSDFAQGIVHVFDQARGEARYFGADEPLYRPFGLALDSAGNLYVAEQEKQQIRVIDPGGNTLRFFRSDRLVRPVDIEIDEGRNRLYVADGSHQNSKEHYVRIFDLEGNYLGEIGDGRGSSEGRLLFPTYLAVDESNGSVYVADTMNSRISVFDAQGEFVRTIGSRGDGFGLFDKPKGVDLDAFGNVYVVDSSWSNVQIFGPDGDVLLYFGGRGGYPGLLRNPTAIAIAPDNTIYVGDYLNRRVTIYRLVNTEAGDGLPTASSATGEAPIE